MTRPASGNAGKHAAILSQEVATFIANCRKASTDSGYARRMNAALRHATLRDERLRRKADLHTEPRS